MIQKISYNNSIFLNHPAFKANDNEKQIQVVNYATETQKAPLPSLLAYLNNIENPKIVQVEYSIPIKDLETKYFTQAKDIIEDVKTRAGKEGQVLNWIQKLPEEQINRLDEIYSLADAMRQNGPQKLGIIGIGGSKHTIENMLTLNKKGQNVVFLSAVDPDSMDAFVEKLGDLSKAVIMVASKSGTTLEPSTGYDYVEKVFFEKFKNDFLKKGLSTEDAETNARQEVSKHFVCITDKDFSKSKLGRIAQEKGYKCGIIHDDCGGRFGAFDDHTLAALAWSGMSKRDIKKMLESSLKAQKRFLDTNLDKNIAMQRALFNTDCILNGKVNQHDYYFSDVFEGTKLWNTQMKKESHKAMYKVSADLIGPEFLHNSTESDLDAENKTSFYTFNKIRNNRSEKYKAYNALIDGSYKSYSERHPVSVIELKDLSPESIGEFVELKHFETLYTGMLLRTLKNKTSVKDTPVLPEVLQPNVDIYKKEVKKILNQN